MLQAGRMFAYTLPLYLYRICSACVSSHTSLCSTVRHQTYIARHAQFSSDNLVCLSVGVKESALTLDRRVFNSILCRNTGVPYLPQGSDTHRSGTGDRASQAFKCSPASQNSCQQSLMHLLPMCCSSCMRLRHCCA